ncbi:MAG: DNA primase [Christensenellaceae bacterium]|jgi:DNA primase|nr:DNA primase [Christensenellaceae bacterium]
MILPEGFIEQVKQANNIVTVASKYLPVKQKGRGYWACCPFHHEKTPSFSINEQNQFYHCFGCGVSGNVISLVRQMENTDFMGAVEVLAKMANIKMPEVSATPEQIAQTRKKQRMLELIEKAREFYCHHIDEAAKSYLHKRGITDELVKKFNIGKSPDWDGVITHLKKAGYTEAELIEAGIAAKSQKGKVYDAMGERITFSIFDLLGNCIGFTGRILPENDNGEVAKYRNTSDTLVFNKGRIVYGADVMKTYLRQNKMEDLIMVEGNVDVISLVAAGFNCTLASMGTALTDFHAKALRRFSEQVYLCFDGDNAGRKATLRSLDILAAEGLLVRVVSLPTDTDPDSFVRKQGAKAFQDLIKSAKPLIDYKLDTLFEQSDLNDNIGKTKYLNSAIEILKTVPTEHELELYLPKVATVAGILAESIKIAVTHKKPVTPAPTAGVAIPKADPNNGHTKAVNFVVASKIHNKDYSAEPLGFLLGEALHNEIMEHKIADLFDILKPEELQRVDHLINYDFNVSDEKKYYDDCIDYLLKYNLGLMVDGLRKLYEQTPERKYLEQMQEIQRRIKNK